MGKHNYEKKYHENTGKHSAEHFEREYEADYEYDEYDEYGEYEEYEEYEAYEDNCDDAPVKSAKKSKRFKKGLIIYLCILAALLVAGLAALWVLLGNYQKKVDVEEAERAQAQALLEEQKAYEKAVYRAPQLAFESWYAQANAEYWTNLWFATKAGAFDAQDAVRSEMERVFAPEAVSCFKSVDYTAQTPTYVLKDADGKALAKVTLSGSELNWTAANVELFVEGNITRSVTAAKGVKVFCNGVELGSEYATEPTTNTPDVLSDVSGILVKPTAWTEYTVSGMLTEPEFTVEAQEGYSVTETEDGNFLLKLESDNCATYQDKAVAFVRAYEYYVLMGGNTTAGNMWATLAHLTPDTQAYNAVLSSQEPIYWNTAHTNIDTSNTTAGDVVVWAYNCYSVDVTYAATASARGTPVENNGCIRVYFVDFGDGFVISHFEML